MPIFDNQSMEFISRHPDQTRRLGVRLGLLLQAGDLVCLEGELGSGKTTLVQGIVSGWGSPDLVTSPTFVLVNVYRHPKGAQFFHVDAYRLSTPEEAEDLDIIGMLENAAVVVEWADRIRPILASQHLWIKMRWVDEDQRDMLFRACGERYLSLLSELRRQIYGIS
ncbi:MAG: tRNA (adenosine(37)-N6)-threonylcarbamoyltransferase complex ATPase subunit type 1 TsaE [Anaerolineales bacterium]